jgi:hypothetical protein
MTLVAILYGLAAFGMAAVSWRAGIEARTIALIILAEWIVGDLLTIFYGWNACRLIGMACDATIGIVLICWWAIKSPRNWIILLALTLAMQLAAHRNYVDGAHIHDRKWMLQLELNVLFVLQLAIIVVGPRAHVGVDLIQRMFPAPRDRYRVGGKSAICVRKEAE